VKKMFLFSALLVAITFFITACSPRVFSASSSKGGILAVSCSKVFHVTCTDTTVSSGQENGDLGYLGYSETHPADLRLICFNRRIKVEKAFEELNDWGFRLATSKELSAFGSEHKNELQKGRIIMAADSLGPNNYIFFCIDRGGKQNPCVYGSWDESMYFLVAPSEISAP
jgi:hypothetical protein